MVITGIYGNASNMKVEFLIENNPVKPFQIGETYTFFFLRCLV